MIKVLVTANNEQDTVFRFDTEAEADKFIVRDVVAVEEEWDKQNIECDGYLLPDGVEISEVGGGRYVKWEKSEE